MTSSIPYAAPVACGKRFPEASRKLRWQIAPATLSVFVGIVLFVLNCLHSSTVMIAEVQRAFEPGNGITVVHGLFCIAASCLFFAGAFCACLAARFWMNSQYRMAISLNLFGVPSLLFLGVILMYFEI